ncbi:MAG: orotidine-5'-phosphate decarboxylase [Eubacteriales bacterium]|nr:orotidine-5'-phosphate decarboxylase [Eubacteriales bacterium]MDY3332967.1 orotidine-5'-phosphate decarboxylase [Gallibacter sp.]
MNNAVIIACDFNSKDEVVKFLDKFSRGESLYIKIGMELFYAEGSSIIKEIKDRGHKIFLDLKLHDIPTTVKKAMKVLSNYDIDMVNVHASGTKNMMKAAIEGLTRENGERPLLIAVTQLTSTSEEVMKEDILIDRSIDDVVVSYAKNAKECGLDGVVCSAKEADMVHKHCGNDFLTVTPGIRFTDDEKGDQKRVVTPAMAKEIGSNFIVVGRSITKADNPVEAYNRCCKDFLG